MRLSEFLRLKLTADKRKFPRRQLKQDVAILQTDGTLICECTLADVSQEGARLKLVREPGAADISIAPHFILSLSKRGNLFRECELVWQKSDEVGVRFLKAKAL